MGVVDGRAYRVTRLVTCKKDVYISIPSTESFDLIPHKAYFGMMMTGCGATSNMGVVTGRGHYVTLDAI